MHIGLDHLWKAAYPVGVGSTVCAYIAEVCGPVGVNDVTTGCAVFGIGISIVGMALQAWCNLPRIVASWRCFREMIRPARQPGPVNDRHFFKSFEPIPGSEVVHDKGDGWLTYTCTVRARPE